MSVTMAKRFSQSTRWQWWDVCTFACITITHDLTRVSALTGPSHLSSSVERWERQLQWL